MPPLSDTSKTNTAVQGKSAMSRVGSFKRHWDDDQSMKKSQDTSVEWEMTPPGEKKLAVPMAALDAKARRLAAIHAAIHGPSLPTSLTNSRADSMSSRTVSSSSTGSTKRSAPDSTDSSEPPLKKRDLPWDEDHMGIKAAQRSKVAAVDLSSARPQKSSDISISARIVLSHEQQFVLKTVLGGKNVFFTGSAGTGKSVLLREIIRSLRKKHSKSQDAVAITASTGIAACNIGGITLHSFSGAGIAVEDAEHLANKIRKNKKAGTRWARTQVLIIDEVSMVDADLFDKLAKIATILKRDTRPFGGIQLIVTGDFFQLPPVVKGSSPKFAFEAESWNTCIDYTFNLTQVFRQKDPEFIDMLNEMRFGNLTQRSIARFKGLSRTVIYDDNIEPTELFPRREDVDQANHSRIKQLDGEVFTYPALDGGTAEAVTREKLLSNFMAPKEIKLRVNSQVMLIKNTDEVLVNGSMGKVEGFYDPATFRMTIKGEPIVEEETFDMSTAAGKKAFERKKRREADGKVVKFPLVEFVIPGGGTRKVLIQPESFKVELPSGEIQASRTQVPLILAWAMSIHKSQGQTIDRVKVDLGKVFEKGQAYVALSRATSLQGLQVLNFDPKKVQAHPKVAEWSKTLSTFPTP